jgi:hypothetical protein
MHENAPTLEDELLKWANDNEVRRNKWLTVLIENDVEDLQTLDEMDFESFQVLLDALKARNQAVLIQKLKIWYEKKHSEPGSPIPLFSIIN